MTNFLNDVPAEKLEPIAPGQLYPGGTDKLLEDSIMLKVRSRINGVKYGEILLVAKEDVADGNNDVVLALVDDWKAQLEAKLGHPVQVEYMRSDTTAANWNPEGNLKQDWGVS